MFEEYSLADSQSLGTGYIINPRQDGSVSLITDDMADQESKTTRSEKMSITGNGTGDGNRKHSPRQQQRDGEATDGPWNVFTSLFRVSIDDSAWHDV